MGCPISESVLFDCANPPIGGTQNYVLLYPYDDWVGMKNAGNVVRGIDGTITSISNTVGVAAFRYDTPNEAGISFATNKRSSDGGVDTWDITTNFTIANIEQAQKNQLDAMLQSKVVAISLQKNGKGCVYGDQQGLELQDTVLNVQDPNLGMVIGVQSKTSARGSGETKAPPDIYDTDDATTKSLIEGLIIPGI